MAKRKPTIGTNPLDALLSDPQQRDKGQQGKQQEKQERLQKEAGRKRRFTVHLSEEVIERARNAVFWTPGLTLADLAERALVKELTMLEQERGGEFPQRTEELRGGRPVK